MVDRPKPQTKEPKPRKPPKKKVTPSKTFSTKIANGSAAFLAPSGAVDGRSLPARRFRELTIALASDMGGSDQLSEVQKQLAKRFAGASVIAELAEAKLVAGENVDVSAYTTLTNTLTRLGGAIGIRRAVLDVTPSLADLLAKKVAERSRKDAEDEEEDEGGK